MFDPQKSMTSNFQALSRSKPHQNLIAWYSNSVLTPNSAKDPVPQSNADGTGEKAKDPVPKGFKRGTKH